MTQASFAQELLKAVPEARPVVDEHLRDYDELLLHLLMADLLRLAVASYGVGEGDVTQRLLAFVDRALRDGDDLVENAVCVSFVENVGAFPGESEAFISSWPDGLSQELARQRAWRPKPLEL
jgi:membrane protein required for beta-lactamase induction